MVLVSTDVGGARGFLHRVLTRQYLLLLLIPLLLLVLLLVLL